MTEPATKKVMLYKITAADGSSCHGGAGKWNLPTDKPGRWRTVKGPLVACANGLHLCEPDDLHDWLKLDAIVWEAEVSGETLRAENKTVARKARLVRRVAVMDRKTLVSYACDCAEHVLAIFEAKYPTDKRPRAAIETTRKWLAGEATVGLQSCHSLGPQGLVRDDHAHGESVAKFCLTSLAECAIIISEPVRERRTWTQ